MQQIEEMDKVLEYPTLIVHAYSEGNSIFERWRRVTVENGPTFRIEWWANLAYLYTADGFEIPFDKVLRLNTWPNMAAMNLQFYYEGKVAAVLPIA